MITEIGLDYFRKLPYTKPCNNYLLFLFAFFYFEHVTAIMSENCAINFHRYHFNKILVVFRCFGEIKKFYQFLGLSGIFTGPLREFLGILWYSWVNVWTGWKALSLKQDFRPFRLNRNLEYNRVWHNEIQLYPFLPVVLMASR